MREEKGSHSLSRVVRDIWQDPFLRGAVQILIQANRASFAETPNFPPGLVPHWGHDYREVRSSTAPVVFVPHPLNAADYVDLISRADIGLFLYDSRTYFARCSGVLLEMLCAGVPVIVPAGCWLADQVAARCCAATRQRPSDGVGLIAAGPKQNGELLQEMVLNLDRFRSSAETSARRYRRKHDPSETLRQLLRTH
jgi:glycosyltransferase involved in cell wall biosynthesis